MPASFVLRRVSRCGVAQGYASLAPLPAALLDGHFEHPAMLASTTNTALAALFKRDGDASGRVSIMGLSRD